MKASILITAAVFAMAGTLGTTAWADQRPASQEAPGAPCPPARYHVVSVTPHYVQDISGKRTLHLVGADIRVEAQPGLTPELLTAELNRHLSAMSGGPSMPDCVFGVAGASAGVRSTGDGFVFYVTTPDPDGAKEILRRAHLLG